VVGPGDDPAQSPRDQAGDLSLRWGTGVARPPERVFTKEHDLYLGFVSCFGTALEGGVVFLRGENPEARGAPVGGRASEAVTGGESGLGGPRLAVPDHPARFEGAEAENCLGRGGILRAEPGSDEVRRVLGGRLPDWQWGRRRSVSASGQGSLGAYGDALAPIRRAGDAGSASNLP